MKQLINVFFGFYKKPLDLTKKPVQNDEDDHQRNEKQDEDPYEDDDNEQETNNEENKVVDSRIGSAKKPISTSSFDHRHQFDATKSSNDSLSSVDTMTSMSKKPPPPPRPPSPSPHSFRYTDVTDNASIEIDVFESEPKKYETKTKTKPQSTTTSQISAAATTTTTTSSTHRKSVSFDLSDNEYISVVEHDEPEPSMSDDIGELFLNEENDGYEVPIKYPSGPKSKPTHQVKSILRSPSPSSKAPTTPSSLDRPLRTTYIAPNSNVTAAIVHTAHSSDEEIERENPFRKEFFGQLAIENIYEEVDDYESTLTKTTVQTQPIDLKDKQKPANYDFPKQRPKSSYKSTYETREYSEILTNIHQSSENLTKKSESKLSSQTSSQSTSSLLSDRPKQKPPLPPKPTKSGSSIKSPPPPLPPVIKHADLKQNEALKTFQEEMLHGDIYEFVHNEETNEVIKIKQEMESIPIAITKSSATEFLVEEKTKEITRLTTFNQSSPLPPIPSTSKSPKSPKSPTSKIPPYSKVLKRPSSVERPNVSPPPPPVNLKTLPSVDKIKPIETEDGSRVEILSTSTDDLRKFVRDGRHENAHEYNLVTEEIHREILLQENELRNTMQKEQMTTTESIVTTSRIPVRKAPQPPTAKQQQQQQQQRSRNASTSSDVSKDQHSSSTQSTTSAQIFPVKQILPVQYSHLPTPQQPDYFLTFPSSPSQNCNVMAMPQPGAFSTFMSPPASAKVPKSVSDRKRFFENAMEDHNKPAPKSDKVFSFLSQDEVEKLKQEEEKKIETLKRDKKNKKLLRANDGNNLKAGDDNVDGTSSESDSDMKMTKTTMTTTSMQAIRKPTGIH